MWGRSLPHAVAKVVVLGVIRVESGEGSRDGLRRALGSFGSNKVIGKECLGATGPPAYGLERRQFLESKEVSFSPANTTQSSLPEKVSPSQIFWVSTFMMGEWEAGRRRNLTEEGS